MRSYDPSRGACLARFGRLVCKDDLAEGTSWLRQSQPFSRGLPRALVGWSARTTSAKERLGCDSHDPSRGLASRVWSTGLHLAKQTSFTVLRAGLPRALLGLVCMDELGEQTSVTVLRAELPSRVARAGWQGGSCRSDVLDAQLRSFSRACLARWSAGLRGRSRPKQDVLALLSRS